MTSDDRNRLSRTSDSDMRALMDDPGTCRGDCFECREGCRFGRKRCPFCSIVAGKSHARFVSNRPELPTVIFHPLNPVTEGHVLVVPRKHIIAAHSDSEVAAQAMGHAALYAAGIGPYNLITSFGSEATQTIRHLHVHIVPRRLGDGLRLPWSVEA